MRARVLLAGLATLAFLPAAASGADGDLDTSFSGDGLAEVTVGAGDAFPAAILTSGTQVLIAGNTSVSSPGTDSIAIAALNADGTPDTGYGGGDGIVEQVLPSGSRATVTDAVLQSDSRLVVAGTATNSSNGFAVFIARFTTLGALDTTFGDGNDGITEDTLGAAGGSRDARLAVATDDSLIVEARYRPGGAAKAQLAVARYTAGGLNDSTFGSASVRLLDNVDAGNSTVPGDLDLQSDGSIIAGGTSSDGAIRVARVTPGGSVDTTFATNGYATIDPAGTDDLGSLVVRPDDRILLGGSNGTSNIVAARLTGDGAPDTTFSDDGVDVRPEGDSGSRINALAVRGGRTFAAGFATQSTTTRAFTARYTNAGDINSGWGTPERLQVFHAGKATFFHALDTDPAHLLAAASAQGTDDRYRFGVAALQYGPEPAAPSNDAKPAVNGTATVGSTLTATTGSWTPNTGLAFDYEWQVCATAGATCASYADTADTTDHYDLTAADAGKLVRVRVRATDDGGTTAALSDPVGPVQSAGAAAIDLATPAANAQIALPTDAAQPAVVHVSGTADTGGAATVHLSLLKGATEVSNKDVARDAATGAFADDYAVPREDAAYHLVATHDTATDSVDFTTDATAPLVTITKPAVDESPAGVRVDFAGTLGTAGGDQATLAATLSGTQSATLSPVIGGGGWTASRDLTEGTYTLTVKQSDAAGHQATVTRTFTVAYTVPVLTPARDPEVTGTRSIDSTLTAEPLQFSGTQPVTLTGQWDRCVSTTQTTTCTPIAGATGLDYRTTVADAGLYLRLRVTATNAKGSTPVTFRIAGPISRAGTGPQVVAKPKIDNTTPGVGDTLTTDGGQFIAANNQLGHDYQWFRCKDQNGALACGKIAGATDARYVVAAADGGFRLRVSVVGKDANGSSPELFSDPTEAVPAGCQASITFGTLTATGCFRPEGLTYVGEGTVHVNGLTLEPSSGAAKIIVDPLNLRIATSGSARVIAGPVNLPGGFKLGPVKLYEGKFDFVFQLSPDLNPLNELKKLEGIGLPITGGAPTLKLPTIPGVGNLTAGLPHLDLGLPDFSKLAGDKLKALRAAVPSWNLPAVTFPKSVIPDFQLPAIGFKVGDLPGLGGFNLNGSVTTKPIAGGMEVDAALKIPAPKLGIPLPDLTATATFDVFANGTGTFKGISAVLGTMQLGPLSVENFNLNYSPAEQSWGGGANILFEPIHQGFGTQIGFKAGQLVKAGLSILGDIPVGPTGLVLNELGLDYSTPPTKLGGSARIGLGPKLPVLNVPAVSVDGAASYTFGTATAPGVLRFDGAINLAKNKVSSGFVERKDTGDLKFDGNLNLTVPNSGSPGLGLTGHLGGFFQGPYWQVDGSLDLNGKILGQGAEGHLKGRGSDVGLAGCGDVHVQVGPLSFEGHGGGGFKWASRQWEWFGGTCGLDAYKSAGARRAAGLFAAGGMTVTVPDGLDARAFSVTGATGPPKIELDAPDGTKVASPPAGYNGVMSGRYWVIEDPSTNTTNVLAFRPPAGQWTIQPQLGSPAVTGVRDADPLPPTEVKGSVSGHGSRRVLRYSLAPHKGMAVTFTEESAGASAVIGKAKGRRGTLRFTPHFGPAGTRQILAHVTQDGMPREDPVIASYSAPAPALPGAPRKLRVRLRKAKLSASWKGVAGATGYRVTVGANGASRTFDLVAAHHSFTLPDVWASRAVTVAVASLDPLHRPGKAARRRLKAPKRLKPGKRVKVKLK